MGRSTIASAAVTDSWSTSSKPLEEVALEVSDALIGVQAQIDELHERIARLEATTSTSAPSRRSIRAGARSLRRRIGGHPDRP